MPGDFIQSMLDWDGIAIDGCVRKIARQLKEDVVIESETLTSSGKILRFDPSNNYDSIVKILAAMDSGTILAIGHDPDERLLDDDTIALLREAGVVLAIKSSGTTTSQKTILLTRQNIIEDAISAGKILKIGSYSRIHAAIPFVHSYAITAGIFMALIYRSTIVLSDNMDVVETMSVYKPDIVITVPMVVEALLDESSFKGWNGWLIVGGSKMPFDLLHKCEKVGLKIIEGYGLTECSPVVAVNPPDDIRPGSVGIPLSCNKVSIVNEEIVVSGKNVCYGILDDSGLHQTHSIIYTGDLGKIDNGYLYVSSRKDNIVSLSNGKNLNLEKLEHEIVMSDSRIRDCLITYNGQLHVYVVSDDFEIVAIVNELLSDLSYFISSVDIIREDLNRTTLGKKKRVGNV